MQLFTTKCHERATLRKLWRQTGNSSLLPAKCWPLFHVIRGGLKLPLESHAFFKICFCFVLLYNKSLNDWSLGEQWIFFPLNLYVPLDFVSRNSEILGKQNSLFPSGPVIKCLLLYSWRFSRYSASFHWLVHGHMTSNIEPVSRQMPWAGNVAKTVTSTGKQFTVTCEMLTTVARDQRWPDVVPEHLSAFFKNLLLFCFTI